MGEPTQTPTQSLQDDYFGCLGDLRGSVSQLLAEAGVMDALPPEIAREFALSKNLAWKITKMIRERPTVDALTHIPGTSGFGKFLAAFQQAGSSPKTLDAAKRAFDQFQQMVARQAGDRPALQLLLDQVSQEKGTPAGMHESRRLAYLGNSGVQGIQAKVRFATFFIAPNRDEPETLDSAFLGGILGLRRFRPASSWVLTRQTIYADDGSVIQEPGRKALDPHHPGPGPTLLGDYCSSPIPEVSMRSAGNTRIHELAAGPIGNAGVADLCFGHYTQAEIPRYRDEHNQKGEFHLYLASPVEHLQLDLILHRDLEVDQLLQTTMHLNVMQEPLPLHERQVQDFLPITEEMRPLHGDTPSLATPRVERYGEMVDLVNRTLDWNPQDFRAWRLEMAFPPLPATLIMGFPLQEKRA